MKTLQETFNQSYLCLKRQGFKRSVLPWIDTTCSYRQILDDGTEVRCAVGHLLPEDADTEYCDDLGGVSGLKHRAKRYGPIATLFKTHDEDLMIRLQRVHDESTSPEVMKERLADLANSLNLTIPQED